MVLHIVCAQSGLNFLLQVQSMTTHYDNIAKQYQISKTLPFRQYVEWYSYNNLLGNLNGLSVLDLACGEGFYSRRIKQKGADRVIGVDISTKMIELARQKDASAPLNIDYLVGDVLTLGKIGNFDLVVASYLLNYAQNKEQLFHMCRTIADNLKPGGRFVSINNNPDQPVESYPACKKYGFIKSVAGPLKEGSAITYEFFRQGHRCHFDNYYLNRKTQEWAFKRAGLDHIHWVKIGIDPEGIQKFGQVFWQDFIDYEPIIGIECEYHF
jgi:ubiquinone/menaquinone biosynthesis C-methylase UbiE